MVPPPHKCPSAPRNLSRILHRAAVERQISGLYGGPARPCSSSRGSRAWNVLKVSPVHGCTHNFINIWDNFRSKIIAPHLHSNPSILSFHFSYSFAPLCLFFLLTEPHPPFSTQCSLKLSASLPLLSSLLNLGLLLQLQSLQHYLLLLPCLSTTSAM